MLARQRQAVILEQVRRSGGARVSDLTALLGVSDMTVRRDIDALMTHGMLVKVHGGAVLRSHVTEEPGFAAKSSLAPLAKRAIAARAIELIRPGSAIALSAGTTTTSLARGLTDLAALTVVTNSTTVATTLQEQDIAGRTVILTGGVSTPSAALVGPVAEAAIRSLHFDQLFLGTHGFDVEAGFTSPNLAESETNRVLLSRARQVIVVADSSKWRTVGLATFGELSEADILITDDGLPAEAVAQLRDTVGELVIVASTTSERGIASL